MNGKYLLDTNIIIAVFANEKKVLETIKDYDNVFIPSIVIGELYYGASKSSKVKENSERIKELSDANTVLTCDSETAKFYGEIKHQLHSIGKPIPENDIWIAAIAQQHGLILITRDNHFTHIKNLTLEIW